MLLELPSGVPGVPMAVGPTVTRPPSLGPASGSYASLPCVSQHRSEHERLVGNGAWRRTSHPGASRGSERAQQMQNGVCAAL